MSSSSGDGGTNPCGNGVKDPGEQCDGDDFGGKTCASYGLGSGSLTCNMFCGVVASSCVPNESCSDFIDNDQDGAVDCADSDCTAELVCTDSCFSPQSISLFSWVNGDSTGRPSVEAASCSPASGPEVIFQFQAPQSGTLMVNVGTWSFVDFSVSLRTACNDAASELVCTNKVDINGGQDEVLSWEVVAGQTYFIVVDGVNGGFGQFYVNTNMPTPEQFCSDFFDDDADGYIDCDDPTDCQSSFECMPGATVLGQPCFSNNECVANMNDPVCLSSNQGFPDGYCSEWCDVAAQDCSSDGVCVDIGLKSVHGVCLDGCTLDSDCRVGYSCVDKGLSAKVCVLGPEATCDNNVDDDLDSFIDCEDPDCQSTAACMGGAKATGQPCTLHNECYSTNNDPICLSVNAYGYPDGYCSEFCNFMNDCGPGAVCSSWLFFPSGAGTCMHTCVSNAQCRPGYACLDVGMPEKICVF
jgi:hypothetical protein